MNVDDENLDFKLRVGNLSMPEVKIHSCRIIVFQWMYKDQIARFLFLYINTT